MAPELGGTFCTLPQLAPLVVNDSDSPVFVDSASAATMAQPVVAVTPLGGVIVMFRSVTVTVAPSVSVYSTGVPPMPMNELLPKAAPLHEGAATASSAAP